jgi:hypothetical protein
MVGRSLVSDNKDKGGRSASRAEADRGGRGVTAGGVGLW